MTLPNRELRAIVVSMAKEGLTTRQIAEETGYSIVYVRRIRHEANLSAPASPGRPSTHTDQQWAKARYFLEDGASYRDTAETVSIPKTTLREHLPGHGWTQSEGGVWGYSLVENSTLDIRKALIRKRTD